MKNVYGRNVDNTKLHLKHHRDFTSTFEFKLKNVAFRNLQMGNVRQFLKEIKDENKKYHFIEVMACPGGCIGGGGLPQSRDDAILAKRMSSIYSIDERKVKRKSHKNPEIVQLYDNVLGKPLSRVCHKVSYQKLKALIKGFCRSSTLKSLLFSASSFCIQSILHGLER